LCQIALSGLTPPVFYYPGRFRLVAGYARDNPVYRADRERGYALRRKSAAAAQLAPASRVARWGQGPASPRPAPRASRQRGAKSVAGEEFQLWKLKDDHTATLTCEDGNGKAVFSKAIEYTDFPLPEIALYFTNKTILLPSEY
jgi:hypothetical protein